MAQIKEFEPGDTVSYGMTYTAEEKRRIAVVQIGYADGLRRALSGKLMPLINGVRVPQVGRICMDLCMIDVTDIEGVKEGDEVVIFSPAKGNTLEDMAEVLGTISYEIMTSVSARVKRIYVRE